ncbi:hypothetical protein [Natranaerobius trueperi]|uniref:Type I-B CRISPR-associated protein Cas8b1/Cst1 n=1 Tax=Natranaerobius trueperi TaxID=759412 RepID=A0A226BZX2_9FIRM|nr:hypothetical protein [Natranaerobius trueperi]OWZ83739.1 hypothetical protein CDO51_07250 [Natranaerobius trueperi]
MEKVEIKIDLPGDPWQMIGAYSLYRMFKNISHRSALVSDLQLNPSQILISFSVDDSEKIKSYLYQEFKDDMNSVPLRPIELKLLGIDIGEDTEGFVPSKLSPVRKLTSEEKQKLKELGIANPSSSVDMTQKRSYIGLRKNWDDLKKSYKQDIDAFLDHWSTDEKKKKICPVCGRSCNGSDMYQMNQSKNVFYNQHHNVKPRGYFKNVSKEKMCSVCNFLNVLASLLVDGHPYFVGDSQKTHLFIPQVNDFESLQIIYDKLATELYNMREANLKSYRTNIRNLNNRTLYVSLLSLYFWLQYEFQNQTNSVNQENQQDPLLAFNPFPEPKKATIPYWTVPRYQKQQNVVFYHFSRINTDHKIFDLVKPLEFGLNQETGNIVQTFFNKLWASDQRLIDDIARGIVDRNLGVIRERLFTLYKAFQKDSRKNKITSTGVSFFRSYIKFLSGEVMELISQELNEDLKKLGNVIGRNCAENMSILTKLNNAATQDGFRQALKETQFSIYKDKVSELKRNNNQDENKSINIGVDRMERILNALNSDNFNEIKDTLLIYTSLGAFNKLNGYEKE